MVGGAFSADAEALADERQKLVKRRKRRIGKRAKQLEAAIKEHLPLRVRPREADVDPAKEAELRAFVEARVAARRAEVERLFENARRRGVKVVSDREGDQ